MQVQMQMRILYNSDKAKIFMSCHSERSEESRSFGFTSG
jgi:hypothetical protein